MYTSIHLTTYAHDYRVLEVFENVPNWVHNIGTEEWGVYVVIEARGYLSPIIMEIRVSRDVRRRLRFYYRAWA